MSVVTVTDQARLRLGFVGPRGRTDPFGIDTQPPGRQTGVVVWGEAQAIPPGSLVFARVDRPTLVQPAYDPADHFIPAAQGYVFESAERPAALTVGGAVQRRGRQRILHVAPGNPGRFEVSQQEPAWAAVATTPAIVTLVPEGNGRHAITMPGQTGSTPDLPPADTHLLRWRWTGTVVAPGATILALTGGETFVSGVWPSGHKRLVPGSIVMTLPGPFTVRDTGDGRLVGVGGGGARFDGTINYVTGDWEMSISGVAIGAGNITAGYEHSCDYAPLDIQIEWDALLAQ